MIGQSGHTVWNPLRRSIELYALVLFSLKAKKHRTMELRLRVYTQFGWEIMVGAVLIKNYSSIEKYVKKVPRGFS